MSRRVGAGAGADAEVEKIAVFRGLYLGDLVAATGALRTLRRGYPRAEITLVSLPPLSALVPHLAPHVDDFLPYPGAPGLDGWEGGAEERLETFLEEVRERRFDLAVNMHGRGPTSTRLVASFGARTIASFVGSEGEPPGDIDLDVAVPWDAETHESRKLLLLAEKAGGMVMDARDAEPGLRVRAEDYRRARTLLPTASLRKPLALVHPGASVPEKRWPEKGFGQVVRGLAQRGYAVAVTGGAAEKDLTHRVSGTTPGVVDLGGRTDLSTLVALVALSEVLVANDTGPAHLAYALKTPSVTLFGPSTDAERWGPLSRDRHAILHGDPISDIAAGEVLRVVEALVPGEERSA